ncbi:CoA transferase [Dactylosporangium sp. NPDC051541]|uniref:CoA transferase n=1 Tax=Dactylosporangium sp. NPDC051541 TaxID=3363977 RepID=UPI0037B4AF5B
MTPLAVDECALEAVTACLDAAADLAEARGGRRPLVELDPGHALAAVRSEALLRDADGRGIGGFAPLSRLWRAADGWVRTHANYPWHRQALLATLGPEDGLERAIAALPALEVERRVYEAGGLAVAARTTDQWTFEPGPLISIEPTGQGQPPAPLSPVPNAARLSSRQPKSALPASALPASALPASGLRVLDLTRVIAGPVGTRMLAALGAEVLRVDSPRRPELSLHAFDGVIGKASTLLDADTPDGYAALQRLAGQADVIVTGYRPGAMRRLGLDTDRFPDKVVATLSAWGTAGEWGDRRGFDSLVQVATGIGWACGVDGARPGALPYQLLDHATGYLLAAGVLTALARGGGAHVSVSLVRTARWLLDHPPGRPQGEPGDFRTDLGNGWSGITPPGRLDGVPLRWPRLPPAYGQAPPAFTA